MNKEVAERCSYLSASDLVILLPEELISGDITDFLLIDCWLSTSLSLLWDQMCQHTSTHFRGQHVNMSYHSF